MSQLEQQSAVRNRLLAALPPDGFAALAPALRPVELDFRQTLHRPDRPLECNRLQQVRRRRASTFFSRRQRSRLPALDQHQARRLRLRPVPGGAG